MESFNCHANESEKQGRMSVLTFILLEKGEFIYTDRVSIMTCIAVALTRRLLYAFAGLKWILPQLFS